MENDNRLNLLDCSLRDGGYYTSWDFAPAFVDEYLTHLNSLPVDYVELGYRSKQRSGYLGPYFYCPEPILKRAAQVSKKKLAIIINEKEVIPTDLMELLKPCQGIIDLVRIAVAPQKLGESIKLAEAIKKMGFKVSLNLMYLSKWESEKGLIAELKSGNDFVDYLYLVDSYGGVYPKDLERLITNIKEGVKIRLGFHAHNNLEMAFANTLTAIESGVDIVDSTVMGMGRGAGNLKTELLLTGLQSKGYFEVDYDRLSSLVALFSDLMEKYAWGTNLAYMVSGANSLPQQEVMDRLSKRYYSLNSVVRGIYNQSRGIKDNLDLQEFSPEIFFDRVIIIGGGPLGTLHSDAIIAFSQQNTSTCIIHASSKNAAAYKQLDNLQVHCLAGNEGHRLEKVYSQLEKKNKLAILPPFPRAMGTYIPEALKGNAFQLKEFTLTNEFPESVTALAIETALKFHAKEILFVGYDGYETQVSGPEMELFQENEQIFETLGKEEIPFSALTSTKYSRLKQESVYAYL